ncbi:MAG: hypothetical protein CMO59_09000 [Verrucomicrobiales bacterium]|nr:hypothetical protein [Verrucomicrobiales bacterium]MBT16104.1 hypothetical protein [Verrucomicrobiales bacterium]|tara:strand:+ start:637 stop:837 length:201 start_codon:yes stop_codon:yes gene_type:complete
MGLRQLKIVEFVRKCNDHFTTILIIPIGALNLCPTYQNSSNITGKITPIENQSKEQLEPKLLLLNP